LDAENVADLRLVKCFAVFGSEDSAHPHRFGISFDFQVGAGALAAGAADIACRMNGTGAMVKAAAVGLLRGLPNPGSGEVFEDLLRLGPVRLERIVSSPFPDDKLYDQGWDEWVLLLQGEARLWVEGEELALGAGDSLFIPAHRLHRVLHTSAEPLCVWLSVQWDQATGSGGDDRAGALPPD
jgi:cupin 2 domain-containing protein